MNKLYLVIALLLGLVVGLSVSLLQPQAPQLAGQSNFSGPVNSEAGFQESGTEIISTDRQASFAGIVNTSGTSVGSGTNIVEIRCGTATFDPAALANDALATTSVDVAVTGATVAAGTNQAYFAGFGTSSLGAIALSAAPSGTVGTVNVLFFNPATSSINLGEDTVSACYLEF